MSIDGDDKDPHAQVGSAYAALMGGLSYRSFWAAMFECTSGYGKTSEGRCVECRLVTGAAEIGKTCLCLPSPVHW